MSPVAPLCLGLLFMTTCSSHQLVAVNSISKAAAEKSFDRLKSLSGGWYLAGGTRLGKALEASPEDAFLAHSISSGGHAVIEKLFVGQPREMTTVYYLDQGRLRMDHYCSLGNQPRMVATPSDDNEISFRLLSVDNMPNKNDIYISSHAIEFSGPEEITAHWGATQNKKKSSGSMYRVKLLK